MRKRWAVAAAAATVVTVGAGGLARATPPETLTFICENAGVVNVNVKGGSRVASTTTGDRYKVVIFEVSDGDFNFTKVYGSAKDQNNPDIQECVSPDGVITIQVIPA